MPINRISKLSVPNNKDARAKQQKRIADLAARVRNCTEASRVVSKSIDDELIKAIFEDLNAWLPKMEPVLTRIEQNLEQFVDIVEEYPSQMSKTRAEREKQLAWVEDHLPWHGGPCWNS